MRIKLPGRLRYDDIGPVKGVTPPEHMQRANGSFLTQPEIAAIGRVQTQKEVDGVTYKRAAM